MQRFWTTIALGASISSISVANAEPPSSDGETRGSYMEGDVIPEGTILAEPHADLIDGYGNLAGYKSVVTTHGTAIVDPVSRKVIAVAPEPDLSDARR